MYSETMSIDSSPKKNRSKNILSTAFNFILLSKLYNGYRPAQIATQLGVSPQAIKYHTDILIEANLIRKDTANGIQWKLTEKGLYILKQRLTGSVNPFNNYQTKSVARLIPTRLDNVSFAFKILGPIPEDPNLHWSQMMNGVSKCAIKYDTHTVEILRSQKGGGSSMAIHMQKAYCFDWIGELIRQYNFALHYAKQAAIKYRIEVSDYGHKERMPHIAFEEDLIAQTIATSHTAETKTQGETEASRAWVDHSNGSGEFETDDPDYAYLYLMMPKTLEELANISRWELRYKNAEYEQHYHPSLTKNN
jgi:hypothetical protein